MPDSPLPTPDPPAAYAVRLTDFEAAAALFTSWRGRFEQLSGGRFEAALRVVRGGTVRVVGIEANQRVLVRGHDAAGLFSAYPVTDGNAADLWQGHRLPPGRVVISGPDAEVDHCSGRRTSDLGVSLRPEALAEAARALLAADVLALPRGWAVSAPPPDGFAEFHGRLSRLLAAGGADPACLGTSEGHRLEQECVRALVACLCPPAGPPPGLSLPARARVVRRAEEFMRARLGDPVGAVDLCRELGVSDRTLRLAFRERYGMGPLVYFKSLRLNAARSRLKADPLVAVADVARMFGFHHLGNFAADYRRLFGERPSATPRGAGEPAPPADGPK